MSICCKAIRQIYYNAGSGYTVASYMTNEDLPEEVKKQKNGNYGIFQAFGTELPTNEGLDVELTGDWKPTKYGMQYSVSNFSVTMPTTKEGIRTYLSSSLIKGIGPAMAARIVETFGEDTLNVFNDSPEKLLQVKGITQKRLDDIMEGYQKSSSMYDFCMESEIPVLVCGHHTDGYRHENLKDETVYLHCCADFETDEKDRFRIAGMQPYGSNRDGTALWYAGSRLLERPEKQKLLFVISDGAPNANQYGGTGAKRDLQKIRKKLLQQGVFFQAAAIGSDKEAIQEIYEESFLDITDLEQLPALLTKKLLRFIRR